MAKFEFVTGDINFLDYGGTWGRKLSGKRIGETRRFHFIRLINWEDACGSDAPKETYNVELSEVNLSQIGKEDVNSALAYSGVEDETRDEWLALACFEYGLHAPLSSVDGNNFHKLFRQAVRESRRVETDLDYRYQQLDRPVNAIGSTAAELMRGDIYSAIERGLKSGDPKAKILVKMYGVK